MPPASPLPPVSSSPLVWSATPGHESSESAAARSSLLRLLAAMLRLLFRIRVRDAALMPARGAALLVANHVSYIDALLIGAACPRPVRFVMWHGYFDNPWFRPVCRLFGAIPIAGSKESPARLRQALDAIDAALAEGQVVAIFPEGRLTDDGEIGVFRPGVESILRRRPVPVIPVALQGMWRSLFSKGRGRPGPRWLRQSLSSPAVRFGAPLVGQRATAELLRVEVAALRGDQR